MVDQLTIVPETPPTATAMDCPLADLPDPGGVRVDPAFVRSIAEYGVLQPILVKRVSNGYRVVAGRRRVAAARLAGHKAIPARLLRDDGWTSDAALTIVENEQRSDNLSTEMDAVEALVSAGHGEADICRATGMSPARMRRVMRLLGRLDPGLRAALAGGDLRASVAESAAKLPEVSQAEIAERIGGGERITARDVAAYRRVTLADEAAGLPESLFGSQDQGWHRVAIASLRSAIECVPPGHDILASTIADAIRMIANDQADAA